MARRVYKTARGKKFNMQEFSDARKDVTAVGNMNVNARGDVLGQGGHIVQKREEIVREYYHEPPAQETEVSLKKDATATKPVEMPETFVSPEEAIQTLLDQQSGTKKKGAARPAAKKPTIKGSAKYAAPATKEDDGSIT